MSYGDDKDKGANRRGPVGNRSGGKVDTRQIFVAGLSKEKTNKATFTQFFKSFGEIEHIALMMNPEGTGGHRGFGFVTYKDQAVTDNVLEQESLQLDGQQIDCKISLPGDFKLPVGCDGKKIFIGSLPKAGYTSEDLKEYFTPWGTVTSSWVAEGRGFGFITFESSTSAYKALAHGLNIGHCVRENSQVDVKWPLPRPEIPSRYPATSFVVYGGYPAMYPAAYPGATAIGYPLVRPGGGLHAAYQAAAGAYAALASYTPGGGMYPPPPAGTRYQPY